MSTVSNLPAPSVIVPVPPDAAPYLLVCLGVLVAVYLYRIRYFTHERAHLVPPPEWCWLLRLFHRTG